MPRRRLCKLPKEIRQHILRQLFGNHTIHLTLDRPSPGAAPTRWRFCLCTAAVSDAAAHARFAAADLRPPAAPAWAGRHDDCVMCIRHGPTPPGLPPALHAFFPPAHTRHRLHALGVLRAGRALRAEAEEVLYGANAFAVSSPYVLRRFLDQRTPRQCSLISHLAMIPARVHIWKPARDDAALTRSLMRPLPRLRALHLDVVWCPESGDSVRARRLLTDPAFLERRLRGLLVLGSLVADARQGARGAFRLAVTFSDQSWQRAGPPAVQAASASTDGGGAVAALLMPAEERMVALRVHAALWGGGTALPDGLAVLQRRLAWQQRENARRHAAWQRNVNAGEKRLLRLQQALGQLSRTEQRQQHSTFAGMLVQLKAVREMRWPRAAFSEGSDEGGGEPAARGGSGDGTLVGTPWPTGEGGDGDVGLPDAEEADQTGAGASGSLGLTGFGDLGLPLADLGRQGPDAGDEAELAGEAITSLATLRRIVGDDTYAGPSKVDRAGGGIAPTANMALQPAGQAASPPLPQDDAGGTALPELVREGDAAQMSPEAVAANDGTPLQDGITVSGLITDRSDPMNVVKTYEAINRDVGRWLMSTT